MSVCPSDSGAWAESGMLSTPVSHWENTPKLQGHKALGVEVGRIMSLTFISG